MEKKNRASDEEVTNFFLLDNAPFGACAVDTGGYVKAANGALSEFLRVGRDCLVGKTIAEVFPLEMTGVILSSLESAANGDTKHFYVECRLGEKEPTHIRGYAMPLPCRTPQQPNEVWITLHDITETKRIERLNADLIQTHRELSNVENILRTSLDQCPVGIIIAGAETGACRLVNHAAWDMFRLSSEEYFAARKEMPTFEQFMGLVAERYEHTITVAHLLENFPLPAAMTSGKECHNREVHQMLENNEEKWFLVNAVPVRDDTGKITSAVLAIQDITGHKRLEANLRHQATHDALTGLPNRALLKDRLGVALARSRRENKIGGLVFIDLDNFKETNDKYGHDTGDLLLHAVAERCRSELREYDTVARIGGDEFMILLPNLDDIKMLKHLIQRISNVLSRSFQIGGHTLGVTASLGVSVYPRDGDDEAMLIKKADLAMYAAKHRGKNTWCFYESDLFCNEAMNNG